MPKVEYRKGLGSRTFVGRQRQISVQQFENFGILPASPRALSATIPSSTRVAPPERPIEQFGQQLHAGISFSGARRSWSREQIRGHPSQARFTNHLAATPARLSSQRGGKRAILIHKGVILSSIGFTLNVWTYTHRVEETGDAPCCISRSRPQMTPSKTRCSSLVRLDDMPLLLTVIAQSRAIRSASLINLSP